MLLREILNGSASLLCDIACKRQKDNGSAYTLQTDVQKLKFKLVSKGLKVEEKYE
jgi:hypothetical protein